MAIAVRAPGDAVVAALEHRHFQHGRQRAGREYAVAIDEAQRGEGAQEAQEAQEAAQPWAVPGVAVEWPVQQRAHGPRVRGDQVDEPHQEQETHEQVEDEVRPLPERALPGLAAETEDGRLTKKRMMKLTDG